MITQIVAWVMLIALYAFQAISWLVLALSFVGGSILICWFVYRVGQEIWHTYIRPRLHKPD